MQQRHKGIPFSLRILDSSWTTGGGEYEQKAEGWGCGAGEVSGDRYSADLSQARWRGMRTSAHSNALENSLTLSSVALHLPIEASQLVPEQRVL